MRDYGKELAVLYHQIDKARRQHKKRRHLQDLATDLYIEWISCLMKPPAPKRTFLQRLMFWK